MADEQIFRSFFSGGFECSCHRPGHGRRLDLLAATGHDRHAAADYARLRECGLLTARDGVRWHLVERVRGRYDWSSAVPMVRAARDADVEVIWDLCHYGWPDWLDIFSPAFPDHFARFARSFALMLREETDVAPLISPVNEISFFAWAGGDVAYINPLAKGRGGELKAQLVRAAIAACEAVWEVWPEARVVHADPVVNVVAAEETPESVAAADRETAAQYEAWDMLCGRARPELGGDEKYLDIVGVNYYPHNQWWLHPNIGFNPAFAIPRDHPRYRPFREILAEVHARYDRPLLIAETGAGDEERPDWLRYVGAEARAALGAGVPLQGVCLYPIVNFPWWDDERHLHNGLWDYPPDEDGERAIYQPLADELRDQQDLFARIGIGDADRAANRIEDERVPLASLGGGGMTPQLCLFTDSLEPSGVGQHMLTLAAQLRDDYRISYVCPPTPAGHRFLDHADALGLDTLALTVRDDGPAWDQLCAWLRARRVALFHGHAGIGWEGHDGIRAARAAGVPVVVRTEHLPYLLTAPDQRAAHRRLLGQIDRLICVSEAARASFLSVGVPGHQLRAVRNGINPAPLATDRRALHAELGLSPTDRIVLTVGRFTAQKGYSFLAEALPLVGERRPDAHFVWVGTGPLEGKLRARAQELGVAERVHFLGRRADVPALMAAADLFVFPSLFEGLPLVVLEAMAAGLPVVGTRVCGTTEAVADGVTGRLVEASDAAALAEAILETLARPELAARWGAAGRRRVAREFNAARMADETAAVYEELLEREASVSLGERAVGSVG